MSCRSLAGVLCAVFFASSGIGRQAAPMGPKSVRPPLRAEALYGEWEGRIEAAPGIIPPTLGERERLAADRGKRLLGATKLFVRLGPGGAAKLSASVVNGPMKSEVARWSLVGSLVKIERGAKGAPALVGIVPAPGVDGWVTRLTLDLSQSGGRAKGRLVLVRTGYPAPPSAPLTARTPA